MDKKYFSAISEVNDAYKPYLASTLRYKRFMVNETIREWITLLGGDVCLLTHGKITAKIAEDFAVYNNMQGEKVSLEEEEMLVVAAWIHDWGEIIINGKGIGDITYERKNQGDEDEEKKIFSEVVQRISDTKIREHMTGLYMNIVHAKHTKLGTMFNAIEGIGYLQTALRAASGIQGKKIKNWKGLSTNVLTNQTQLLLSYADKYPFIYNNLHLGQAVINNIFQESLNSDIPFDNENNLSYSSEKLLAAYSAWSKSPLALTKKTV